MKTRLALIALTFLVAACARGPDFSQTVLEFQRLKNEGNVEQALSLFADKPSLQFGPLGTITGLNEVRGILEYDRALNTQLRIEECQATGLEVSCRVIETNDWLKSVDIKSITYDENRFTFTSDGRIQSVASTLSAESEQLLGAAMTRFDAWARANQPSAYASLFSDKGAFVYSHENAEKVLALLRKWRIE